MIDVAKWKLEGQRQYADIEDEDFLTRRLTPECNVSRAYNEDA
ncbi:hypothetical protein [Lentisalinibacter sediminis]